MTTQSDGACRVIPPVLPDHAERSERVIVDSLARLPSSWTVLWNVPVMRFMKNRRGFMHRQIDVLALHPRRGIIVLEVKGGVISVNEGTWYTTSHQGDKHVLDKPPMEQVKDQRFALSRFLREHLGIRDDNFAAAVALPDCSAVLGLGPDAPAGTLLR